MVLLQSKSDSSSLFSGHPAKALLYWSGCSFQVKEICVRVEANSPGLKPLPMKSLKVQRELLEAFVQEVI